ncbi:nodal modulator 1 [Colias croceus]|uniref:nodal modulator 1 n=1 Tax=Colias crocea TaxID=72248 RepID=UPI001E27BB09|nr:nodal modulator 1 [Colias croceus]
MGGPILMRLHYFILHFILSISQGQANDILGCGGFVKSHVSLDVSNIEIGLYTKEGSLVEKTECAPTNGYYFLPLYEKGDYILKVHPPAGWSFEPSQVVLSVDGETDQCSRGQDINFSFNGFGITGKVITAGQEEGPSGISVQLVNDKGDVRNTVTTAGGDFNFTPVIPGKYVLKASHGRWKLEPSQATVQVKEGNTVLPLGVLAVKGYDVSGSITSFGSPISGVYVLLYSKEENPKFRVEGCKTALLQGVPDSPICHSITDASGEFSFGLVPAGEYKLVALNKSPGQATVTFNIKPENVAFTVHHDSQYIKNAFEVTGFNIVGTAYASKDGKPVSGARVLLAGEAVATSDATGKFSLSGLKPGNYILGLQHEHCSWDDSTVRVSTQGAHAVTPVAARWRVCGRVSPPRRLALAPAQGGVLHVAAGQDGKWCTYLAPGTYTAKVEVTEQEHRDGLQFYPEWQQIVVASSPVSDISFSQLRATVVGRVVCAECKGTTVTLRNLAADGSYVGEPMYTDVKDGSYTFEQVMPGSVEVSVRSEREAFCWREATHNVAVAAERATVPDFVATGRMLKITSTHDIEVEYTGPSAQGTLRVGAGSSVQCVGRGGRYELRPRACHRVLPDRADVLVAGDMPSVSFRAVAHSSTIRVWSSASGELSLLIEKEKPGDASDAVGDDPMVIPLTPVAADGGYVYEHTLYLAEGEAVRVTPQSSTLLAKPRSSRVLGGGRCEAGAAFRAAPGTTLAGRLLPPVAAVTVTLAAGDFKLTQVTKEDGLYSFGPLEADKQYTVSAEKESYEFSAPDEHGNIVANKLAEIEVIVVDDADDSPLEGALISVSGGVYRRTVASGVSGVERFGALPPAQYYVKANMKEYRFVPPSHIVDVLPPPHQQPQPLVFRGVRVAWSVSGRAVSLGGAAAGALPLRARPPPPTPAVDATATSTGHFRIRGLLPSIQYTLELKESSAPELAGIKLVKGPGPIEVKGKDIEDVQLIVIQPTQITDVTVLVHADIDHYRTLKLTLALETTKQPVYSTKLDPSGFSQGSNPGLMYALPRLAADNKTYVIQIESSLSKLTHSYEEPAVYFNSDGDVKHFDISFVTKVKSSEQELRASSFIMLPLLGALALAYMHRDKILARIKADYSTKRLPRKRTQ